MSIKAIILATATIAASATMATADINTFSQDDRITTSDVLDLGLVRAASNGTVEIYDYRLGTQGKLLGMEAVMAGANTDVRVNVGHMPIGDVIAVLKVDGQPVATQKFDLEEM